jgi:hypothetical protein
MPTYLVMHVYLVEHQFSIELSPVSETAETNVLHRIDLTSRGHLELLYERLLPSADGLVLIVHHSARPTAGDVVALGMHGHDHDGLEILFSLGSQHETVKQRLRNAILDISTSETANEKLWNTGNQSSGF